MRKILFAVLASVLLFGTYSWAQDVLPMDNGFSTKHTSPNYRDSESHPLRILAYVVHPVGWLAREVLFRPFSYFASSTETTRSVMGYRYPYDYRQPQCFSADDTVPDCRSMVPFNYEGRADSGGNGDTGSFSGGDRQVYLPDINFDFDKRKLNDLGKGKVHQVARLLNSDTNVHVVLQGHADYKGSDAYNEKLGMDRAEAVRQELVSLGVASDRLSTVTFGETQPVFTEQEDWARAVNRRVEVQVGKDKKGDS